MDYKEIIKERLNSLSPELRAFVLDENWRRDAEKTGKQFNLSEEKYTSLENEIFLALLCFEPPSDFAENIKRELEIDTNMAGWIAEDVDKNIFSKVANEIDLMWKTESAEQNEKIEGAEKSESEGVGESFEQIILNQAKAMQPARPAGEVPQNLPTENSEPKAIHNYISKEDPYREPVK